jgi:S-adenosylhomocysteine hydrolase
LTVEVKNKRSWKFDNIITTTGNKDIVRADTSEAMKDKVIVANITTIMKFK